MILHSRIGRNQVQIRIWLRHLQGAGCMAATGKK